MTRTQVARPLDGFGLFRVVKTGATLDILEAACGPRGGVLSPELLRADSIQLGRRPRRIAALEGGFQALLRSLKLVQPYIGGPPEGCYLIPGEYLEAIADLNEAIRAVAFSPGLDLFGFFRQIGTVARLDILETLFFSYPRCLTVGLIEETLGELGRLRGSARLERNIRDLMEIGWVLKTDTHVYRSEYMVAAQILVAFAALNEIAGRYNLRSYRWEGDAA